MDSALISGERGRERRRVVEGRPEVIVLPSPTRLAQVAAERFAETVEKARGRSGRFTVALSGGATPQNLYSLLAAEPYRSRLSWEAIHVFWGDERCVPPEHGESNYGRAAGTWLRHVLIPPGQIHRMRGEDPRPDQAAAEYEQELRVFFRLTAGRLPHFDLILLGMGADGHIASLFPHSAALREERRLVVAPYVERIREHRLTLTLPVFNAAAALLVLVVGREKARTLKRVLEGAGGDDPLPAQRVFPRDGVVTWLVDAEAAHLLEPPPGEGGGR